MTRTTEQVVRNEYTDDGTAVDSSVFMESQHGQRAIGTREGNSGHSQQQKKKHNFDKRAAMMTFFQFSHAWQQVSCPSAAKFVRFSV